MRTPAPARLNNVRLLLSRKAQQIANIWQYWKRLSSAVRKAVILYVKTITVVKLIFDTLDFLKSGGLFG